MAEHTWSPVIGCFWLKSTISLLCFLLLPSTLSKNKIFYTRLLFLYCWFSCEFHLHPRLCQIANQLVSTGLLLLETSTSETWCSDTFIKLTYTFLNPGWIISRWSDIIIIQCSISYWATESCAAFDRSLILISYKSAWQQDCFDWSFHHTGKISISVSEKLRPKTEEKVLFISEIWVELLTEIRLEALVILIFHLSISVIDLYVWEPSENLLLCSGYIPPRDIFFALLILPAACWELAKLNSWPLLSGLLYTCTQVRCSVRGNITELTLSSARPSTITRASAVIERG